MGLLGKIWVKLGLDNSDYKKGIKESQTATSKFKSYIKTVGAGIVAAFSVRVVTKFLKEVSSLGAVVSGVKRAFDKIGNEDLLKKLRVSTQGMVTDIDLMKNAIKAHNFRIPLDQLATYFEFATMRAAETGESVDFLVQSIITGLGRQSVMILDNLGLSVTEIREEMRKGADMSQAVGAIISRTMGKDAKNAVSDMSKETANLTTEWNNFKASLGEVLNTYLAPILRKINEIVDKTKEINQPATNDGLTFWQKLFRELNPTASGAKRFALQRMSEYDEATQSIIEYINTEERAKQILSDIDLGLISGVNINKIKSSANGFLENINKPAQKAKVSIASLKKEIEELTIAVENETDSSKRSNLLGQIEQKEKQIESLSTIYKNGLIPQLEAEIKKREELLPFLKDQTAIRSLNDEIKVLQKRLSYLQMTSAEFEKINQYRTNPLPAAPSTPSSITGAGVSSGIIFPKLDITGIDVFADELKDKAKEIEITSQDIAWALTSSIGGAVDELVTSLMETGKVDTASVANALMQPFFDMAGQLGQVLIASGLGALALNSLITNPITAIAAGAALVALSAAASAAFSSAVSNRGGASSMQTDPYAYSGGMSSVSLSPAAMSVSVTGRISGQDIYLSNKRTAESKRR